MRESNVSSISVNSEIAFGAVFVNINFQVETAESGAPSSTLNVWASLLDLPVAPSLISSPINLNWIPSFKVRFSSVSLWFTKLNSVFALLTMFVFTFASGKLNNNVNSRKAFSASVLNWINSSPPVTVVDTVPSAFKVHPGFFAGSKTAVPVEPSTFV